MLCPTGLPADLSQTPVNADPGLQNEKMAPETGAICSNYWELVIRLIAPGARKSCICRTQRPKRGRSPLRTAMRLLWVSRRSMEAIRRLNRELEGRRPTEAVLDMCVPFLKQRSGSASFWGDNMYTRCHTQRTCLHSSNFPAALQQN